MEGVINANEGQSAAAHKVTGQASHLVRKEDKLKAQCGLVVMQLQFLFTMFRKRSDAVKVLVHLTLFPGLGSQNSSKAAAPALR